MRVVAGSAGGLTLEGPPSEATRPTTDKVREAIFNSLNSALDIEQATVLDLFAGTGACGIEALSRGAVSATFVEKDRRALEVLQSNLRRTSLEHGATVVRGDVMSYVQNRPRFDVVFADPPYVFDSWAAVLDHVQARVFICETNRPMATHARWKVTREKKYGTTFVTFLEPVPAAPAEQESTRE